MTTTIPKRAKALLPLVLCASTAFAQDMSLPTGAELTYEFNRNPGAYDLPIAVWTEDTGLPTRRVEGAVQLQAWRIDGTGLTPLQLLAPLREQLVDAGYTPVLDCLALTCGGFDFRFGTTVLPAPDMFVNLTDFQFLSAEAENGDAVSVLASRDRNAGYVQIIRAGREGRTKTSAPAVRPAESSVGIPVLTGSVSEAIERDGFAVLSDMVFASGSSNLQDGDVASLEELAAYLKANPSREILFVGHTDAVGSLSGNQSLSRKRANAAVTYLRERHNIPAAQLSADGVGFLSPVATNLTSEGRDANRRVEAVLISTQ